MNFNRMLWFRVALVVVIAACLTTSAASAGEIDLLGRSMIRNLSGENPHSWVKASESVGGSVYLPCLIKTADAETTVRAIEDAGGEAKTLYGAASNSQTILTARLPVDAVTGIAAREEVVALEVSVPLSAKMDTARHYSAVDVVQSGSALGIAYKGKNVVVGAVDDTLDYGNTDFINADGVTRVQYLQETTGTSVVECKHAAVVNNSCAITDNGQGGNHGTHVTGIAAGSNATYTGVAPEADIMFIFNSAADADPAGAFATAVLDGVSTIFSKADIIDKPAVVNLSLGTSIGAHDGTSLLEEGLSNLSAAKGGRIIVNAAGNEQVIRAAMPDAIRSHVGGIHAPISAPAGESRGWRIGVWNGSGAASAFTGGTLADVWLDAGQKDSCSIAAFAYSQGRQTTDFTFPGLVSTDNASFATGNVAFATDTPAPVTATDGSVTATLEVNASDVRNTKPHATILFSPNAASSALGLQKLWFDVVIRSTGGAACSGHMWLYYDFVFYHDFLTGMAGTGHDVANGAVNAGYALADGDSQYTTTIPATAKGVIAAGSYMPPKPIDTASSKWTADDGNTYDQSDLNAPGGTGSVTNDLSGFSSLGPTADGRIKPDVVAPGEPIISTKARGAAISSSLTVGGSHFKDAGTSMSSPHVSGIVALLLQRNNTLTVDQVRTALKTGAHTDGMTAKTPDAANSYGAGKVDAAAVLLSVAPDTSLYHGTGDLDGGGGGSSSCSLANSAESAASAHAWMIACAFITTVAAVGLIRRRARRAGCSLRTPC